VGQRNHARCGGTDRRRRRRGIFSAGAATTIVTENNDGRGAALCDAGLSYSAHHRAEGWCRRADAGGAINHAAVKLSIAGRSVRSDRMPPRLAAVLHPAENSADADRLAPGQRPMHGTAAAANETRTLIKLSKSSAITTARQSSRVSK